MLIEGLYRTYKGMFEMIFMLFVGNVMFSQILNNYDLEFIPELENLGKFSFMIQAFRIALGDLAIANYNSASEDSIVVIISLWFFTLIYIITFFIIFSNFIIALVSEIYAINWE